MTGNETIIERFKGVITSYSIHYTKLYDNISTQTTGARYQQSWDTLYRNLMVKFAVTSGYLNDVLPGISYDSSTDLISIGADVTAKSELLKYVALLPRITSYNVCYTKLLRHFE